VTLERETLHIMDDKQRVALVETRTQGDDGTPVQLERYQFGNHLGSASLELDAAGQIISYEEYYPYGSTSYQAVDKTLKAAGKRYRYTGKERDEENGFGYHGARYYAPWLGRWTSCDPAGFVDGTNLYAYCRENPVIRKDERGTTDDPADTSHLAMGKKPSGTSLTKLPKPQPKIETKVTDARAAGNVGAARARRVAKGDPTGMKVPEAGDEMAHMSAARHNQTSAIPNEIANDPKNISAMPASGKNATVTNPDGSVRQTDFHAAHEDILNEIQARNQAGKAPGTVDSSMAAQNALEEAKIKSEYMTREHLNQVKASKPAAPEPGPPVDPATGKVISSGGAASETQAVVKAEASVLSRAGAWVSETAPAALEVAAKVFTVYGAANEAQRTVDLERQNNRGELNAMLMFGATAVVAMGAGVVDDALAGLATATSGSPAPVADSWTEVGAGPVQHLAGEAIRGFLDWGAHHGL
jgi:RHS repeat-associated protein